LLYPEAADIRDSPQDRSGQGHDEVAIRPGYVRPPGVGKARKRMAKNIIIGFDGSEQARDALALGSRLAVAAQRFRPRARRR
jgi:hypothetical protein